MFSISLQTYIDSAGVIGGVKSQQHNHWCLYTMQRKAVIFGINMSLDVFVPFH